MEQRVGVEPTNVGFADQPPTDEDPPHKRWYRLTGLNRRPSRCKRDALPAELSLHALNIRITVMFQPLTS